jgi:hypothetical protein
LASKAAAAALETGLGEVVSGVISPPANTIGVAEARLRIVTKIVLSISRQLTRFPTKREPRRNRRPADEMLNSKSWKNGEYIGSLFLLPAITV